MNILFVSDVSIKDIIGGAERVLYEQASGLAKRGNTVHILTRRYPYHCSDYEVINNVHEIRYGVNRRNSLTFIISSIFGSRAAFLRLSREVTYDLINFHQPFSALGVNLARRSQRIAKVYSCHSLSYKEYETRNSKSQNIYSLLNYKMNVWLRKFIEKYNICRSHAITVLSEFARNELIQNYHIEPDRITIIPGGADMNKFSFHADRSKVRESLGLFPQKTVLLTIRNLVPRMGLENLIYAMKEIIQSTKDICLLIGGEGILKQKLANLIRDFHLDDFVKLLGFIPHDKLPYYYQAADFFVVPSKCLESFGLVTVEAMACGTPVLGTPVGGTAEILNKFDPDFLFKSTSYESMADLILRKHRYYQDNPEKYGELSKKCRAFVEENYSWKNNLDKIESLFTQLSKKK